MAVAELLDGRLEPGGAVEVDVDDRHAHAAGAERGARDEVRRAGREIARLGERRDRARVAGARERVTVLDQDRGAVVRPRRRVELERLERVRGVRGGGLVVEPGERLGGRLAGERDGAPAAVERGGLVGMVGGLGGGAAAADERVGDRGVEPCPAQRRQLVVDRVADERVRERPAARAHPARRAHRERPDELRALGLVQPVEQRVALLRRGGGEHADVELAPVRGGRLERGERAGREPLDAPADDLADALGDADPVVVRARLEQVAQHLLDEERVALGLGEHAGGEPRLRVADPAADQARGRARVEPVQGDPLGARLAPQVGEQRGQRVTSPEVGLAVRADEQQRGRLRRGGQVGEQPQRRRIGPVQVVEDEQDGTLPGCAARAARRPRRTAAGAPRPGRRRARRAARRAAAAPRRTARTARSAPRGSGPPARWRPRRMRPAPPRRRGATCRSRARR